MRRTHPAETVRVTSCLGRTSGSSAGRPGRMPRMQVVNQLKQRRGLATRYDQHATTYRGAVVLASILTWLQ
jgi:transposase